MTSPFTPFRLRLIRYAGVILSLACVLLSFSSQAQHPGFRWERINAATNSEMFDVISDADAKVYSLGYVAHRAGVTRLYTNDDGTYRNPASYRGLDYVKMRFNAEGVVEESVVGSTPAPFENANIARGFVKPNTGRSFFLLSRRTTPATGDANIYHTTPPSWGFLTGTGDVETTGTTDMYYPLTVVIDSATNEYVALGVYAVTGTGSGSRPTTYQVKLYKYSASGTRLWATSYQRLPIVSSNGYMGTKPTAIAIDRSGNIFVAAENFVGSTIFGDGNPRIEQGLLKFNRSGLLVGSSFYNYGATIDRPSADQISELAVDRLGNVYAAGYGTRYDDSGTPSLPFAFLTKYNNSCLRQWTSRSEYPLLHRALNAKLIVINPNIVYHAFTHNNETILSKYTTSSVPVWTSPSPDEPNSELRDIERDHNGNIYMVKSSALSANQAREPHRMLYGYALLKYNSAGDVVWSTPAEDASAKYIINKIRTDNDNLYLVGYRQSPRTNGGVTISYSLDRFYLPDPPWYGVEPDIFLNPYYDFTLSLRAQLARGWSWTDGAMGWSQRVGYPGALPSYTAAALQNNQTAWQTNFTKPSSFQLPSTQQVRSFSLIGKVANTTQEVFRIDDNLARSGVTEVALSGVSNTQTLTLEGIDRRCIGTR